MCIETSLLAVAGVEILGHTNIVVCVFLDSCGVCSLRTNMRTLLLRRKVVLYLMLFA